MFFLQASVDLGSLLRHLLLSYQLRISYVCVCNIVRVVIASY